MRFGTTSLRLLFCNFEYPPLGGGGGVFMAALARELAKRHDVSVLTSRVGGLPATSIEGGVRVVRVPVLFRREQAMANLLSMFAYLPAGALRGMLMRPAQSFDVINTHFAVPTGPLGHFLHLTSGVPNVLSVHGGDLFDPSKRLSPHRHAWLRQSVRVLLRAADAVVGQSEDTIEHVREIYGVTRQVELIPLGIERPPRIAGGARERWGVPADAFLLVTVGRLVPRKQSLQLVEILGAAPLARAHLLIVGDGPDAPAILAAARERGVAGRVHLAGRVTDDDKYAALAASDVFVSTSQHEGFGLMFLEAMASGLPIVCYDKGGQTDFLKRGVTGDVLPRDDVAAFVRALNELQASKALRAEIAANNLARVEAYFIDRCAHRYEQVFESVARSAVAGARARGRYD